MSGIRWGLLLQSLVYSKSGIARLLLRHPGNIFFVIYQSPTYLIFLYLTNLNTLLAYDYLSEMHHSDACQTTYFARKLDNFLLISQILIDRFTTNPESTRQTGFAFMASHSNAKIILLLSRQRRLSASIDAVCLRQGDPLRLAPHI